MGTKAHTFDDKHAMGTAEFNISLPSAPESSRSCQCGKVREKGKGGGGGGGKLREKEVEEEEKSFASEFNF